jgi:hypothetical protein
MTRKTRLAALLIPNLVLLCSATSVPAQTLRFAAHKDYPAGGFGPASIAVGDINGDARQDLAVANNLGDSVAILLGNADGSFQAPRVVYLGPSNNPRSIAIADFNGDGRADLTVANPTSNTVDVLRGNGDGTFQPVVVLTAGTNPGAVSVGDFNGDGRADLAVANMGSSDVSVLLGNGDGTFQTARTFAAGAGAAFIAVGDFNRDTRPDLAVANTNAGTVSLLLGNGDGNFQAARSFAAGPATWSLAVGDFNGDAMPDVAATSNAPGVNAVSILLGNGDGTLRAPQAFTVGNGPTSVAVGDFNKDGKQDLAVASYQSATSSGAHVAVLNGNGDGTFQAARKVGSGYESYAVAVGDFNADGNPDLSVANSFSTTVSILLGAGDGTFPATPTYAVGRNPESVLVADFNRDGKWDLAVGNAGSHTVSIVFGNGDGTFQPAVSYPTGRGPTCIALGDFNRDGVPDLVATNYGSADYYWPNVWTTVSVLLGNPDGTFQAAQNYEAGPGPNAVNIGDFNGDGLQDLVVALYGPYPTRGNAVALLLGNGDGTFRAPQTVQVGNAPSYVAVGDFNRDGKSDLAVSNYMDGNVSILLGNGAGAFTAAGTITVGAAPWFIVIDDFNGDSVPDLAVSGHWSDIVSVVIGNGDGTFRPHVWYFTGKGPTGIALADLNGDGRRDLAVSDYLATTVSTLLSNGDGTLQASVDFGADLAPMAVAAADFDNDGQPDLAAADYFSSSVAILMNRTLPPRVATPVLTPAGGTYLGSVMVSIATSTSGATIRYTTDGSTPNATSTPYTGPFTLTHNTTVRAIATATGMRDSLVASATYSIQAAPPTFSPASGLYVGSVTVTLSTTTSGATIRYTTDGSAPTAASPAYTGPITLTRTTTIRAITTASAMVDSNEAAADYTVAVVAPSFTPAAGTYAQPQTVALSTPTSGARIYYTTDGSTPTTVSPIYTGPISVTRTTTIRAIGAATGMANSTVASATYELKAATPTFNPPGGSYLLPQLVEISSASPGTTIYYTTDGSTPTTASTHYTGAFLVGVGTTTVRAIAVATGWSQSNVATATYTIPF